MKTAIYVGRFHTDVLHDGYKRTIRSIAESEDYDHLAIVLGNDPTRLETDNPLPWDLRKTLLSLYIKQQYPELSFSILKIQAYESDLFWCQKVDEIAEMFGGEFDWEFIVGRDSFEKVYEGKYPMNFRILEGGIDDVSSSDRRLQISKDPDFLKPKSLYDAQLIARTLIWASQYTYPRIYGCVDMIIFNANEDKVLLGRKANELIWRIPGGFIDPTDRSKRDAAFREMFEETRLTREDIQECRMVDSMLIDDWRYRRATNKIMTTVFTMHCCSGAELKAVASDDLVDVKWFTIDEINNLPLFESHALILNQLL